MKKIFNFLIIILILNTSCSLDQEDEDISIVVDKDLISNVSYIKGLDYTFTLEYDGYADDDDLEWYIDGEYKSSGRTLNTVFDTVGTHILKVKSTVPEDFLSPELKGKDEISIVVSGEFEYINKITELESYYYMFQNYIKSNGPNLGIKINNNTIAVSDDGGKSFETISFQFSIYDFSILPDCENFVIVQDSLYTIKAYNKFGTNSIPILDESSLRWSDLYGSGTNNEVVETIKTAFYRTYIITKDEDYKYHHYIVDETDNSFSISGYDNDLTYISWNSIYYDFNYNLKYYDSENEEIITLDSSGSSKEYYIGFDPIPFHSQIICNKKQNIVIKDIDNDTFYIHDKYGWASEEFSKNLLYSNNTRNIYKSDISQYLIEEKSSGEEVTITLSNDGDTQTQTQYIDDSYFIFPRDQTELVILKRQ